METQLCYQLIHDNKTSRWLQILELLEEHEVVSSTELAEKLTITARTIFMDVKELNLYFEESMTLTGNDQGIILNLIDLQAYYLKKQQLFEQDPFVLFIDGLFNNENYGTKEWAQRLETSPATFQRGLRQLRKVVKKYGLDIVSREKRLMLVGKEQHIRSFFYTFYYEQKLLPGKIIQNRTINEQKLPEVQFSVCWKINQERMRKWLMISRQRICQGHSLALKSPMSERVSRLAKQVQWSLLAKSCEQEGTALFLLSLEESCFVDKQLQQQFNQSFCPASISQRLTECCKNLPSMDPQEIIFLGTWVYFYDQLGLLPIGLETQASKEQSEKKDCVGASKFTGSPH